MAPRGCSKRAETSICVRFDMQGLSCRINKTGLQSPVQKRLFYYFVKRYELVCRGKSENAALRLKNCEMFQSISERFSTLKPLPAGFVNLPEEGIKATLKELVDEQMDDAERIYSLYQGNMPGVDIQAHYPDCMQVDEGSVADPGSEGIVNTSYPPDDSLLNVLPGNVLSEGSPGVPPGVTRDLGCGPQSQLDNPEGRPPPSSRQYPGELNQSMSDIQRRASRYPDILPDFERLKQLFILFAVKLKDREMNEALWLDPRSTLFRRSLEEIPSQLPEGIPAEDPQNQPSMASMEDVGHKASYSQATDFAQYCVKNIETTMPDGELSGLLRNRSISEALEVVPRFTGRLKTNIGDIRPQVYVDNVGGDLQSKPIMEGIKPQASYLQVSDPCGGGENFMTMLNSVGNNTP